MTERPEQIGAAAAPRALYRYKPEAQMPPVAAPLLLRRLSLFCCRAKQVNPFATYYDVPES